MSYYDLGAACYGCGGPQSKTRGKTNPTTVNSKLASKYGWSVRPNGKYKSVSDKTLAMDIYCFQHAVEQADELRDVAKGDLKAVEKQCYGDCKPNVITGDCYNRDGMIGQRTLQEIGNAIVAKTSTGIALATNLNIPSKYIAQKDPPPASDVRADIAQGSGAAGARHQQKIKKHSGVLMAGGTPSWLIIGGLGLIAAGVIAYNTSPSFKAKVKKTLG